MASLPSSPLQRANFRHLYLDIFWFGVLAGSTLAFLSVYATRLGATGFQVSLLTAGPAVVNLFLSLPAGRWLECRPLVRVTYYSAALYRSGYLVLIFLPWLLAPHLEVWALILITLVMSAPGTLLAIGFNALFADAVPPDHRGDVVGRRNALMAVSMTTATLVSGQLLDHIIFPLNYQIVFVIGALGAALSTYHVGKVCIPTQTPPARAERPRTRRSRRGILPSTSPLRVGRLALYPARAGMGRFGEAIRLVAGMRFLTRSRGKPLLRLDLLRFLTRSRGRPLLRLDLLRSSFGRFIAAYLIFYACQFLALPLFPLFFVHELNLSDGAISLGSSVFYAVMLPVSLRMSVLSTRYGHYRLLVLGAITFSVYPLLIGLARSATLFWVASFVGGAVWALIGAALVNRLMERASEEDRPAYMALHNLALNIGILAGSLAGPLLSGWIGLREAILVAAGARLLAGVLLLFWG